MELYHGIWSNPGITGYPVVYILAEIHCWWSDCRCGKRITSDTDAVLELVVSAGQAVPPGFLSLYDFLFIITKKGDKYNA